MQEFRKCIECFLCQDVCHVLRDHRMSRPVRRAAAPDLRGCARDASARRRRPRERAEGRARHRLLQHHEVLHQGLSRRASRITDNGDHSAQGAGHRRALRSGWSNCCECFGGRHELRAQDAASRRRAARAGEGRAIPACSTSRTRPKAFAATCWSVDAANQEALTMLLLALTEQFTDDPESLRGSRARRRPAARRLRSGLLHRHRLGAAGHCSSQARRPDTRRAGVRLAQRGDDVVREGRGHPSGRQRRLASALECVRPQDHARSPTRAGGRRTRGTAAARIARGRLAGLVGPARPTRLTCLARPTCPLLPTRRRARHRLLHRLIDLLGRHQHRRLERHRRRSR